MGKENTFTIDGGMRARKLRFRIWDWVDKKWVKDWGKEVNIPMVFLPEENEDEDFYIDFLDSYNGSPFKFLQCTGLMDKNGKDIYEGDILKCFIKEKWTSDETTEILHIVKHSETTSGESDLAGFLFVPEDREIIGNIFENPELLNK